MRGISLVLVLLASGSCEKETGRRVRVQISNVPAQITVLRARIVLENRQQEQAWSGGSLAAIMGGSTEFTIGLDDREVGALQINVEAVAGSCTLAMQSATCPSVAEESCRSLKVMLPDAKQCPTPMPTPSPSMEDRDDAGVELPRDLSVPTEDLWDGRCSDGGVC